MIFAFAPTEAVADAWAREQGIRPRDVRAFGDRSRVDGWPFQPDDRVVILGEVDRRAEAVIQVKLRKTPAPAPTVERYPLPVRA